MLERTRNSSLEKSWITKNLLNSNVITKYVNQYATVPSAVLNTTCLRGVLKIPVIMNTSKQLSAMLFSFLFLFFASAAFTEKKELNS